MMQGQAERLINQMLLLDPILDQLKTVVEYHGVTVVEVAEGYALNAGYRGEAPMPEILRDSFRTDLPDDTADWLRQHMPMLVADVLDDAPETQWLRQRLRRRFGEFSSRIGSWLCVSLAVGDRLIGVLAVDHRERGHYSPRDVGLVQAFVERRATDIEHAIQYADAARLAGEAQAVLTVQQAIVRRLEPDAILQKVAEEVLRLTAARRALVFLLCWPKTPIRQAARGYGGLFCDCRW
jgi:GAF domain-containing protein